MKHEPLDQMDLLNLNFNGNLNQGVNVDTPMKHEIMAW